MNRHGLRVIIAGGGTGGHLFPGIAIGKEIGRTYKKSEILFVTGRRKLASDILSRTGFQQVSIDVEGMKGRGLKRGMMTLLRLPYSLYQCISLIRRFSPHLVLGVGGYSSGPVCLAAKILGIPTAIHEQNSFPGLTNRLLSRVVDRVFIAFQESEAHFHGGSIKVTGNPIRQELLEGKRDEERGPRPFTVLVVGGSQGASAINRVFVTALKILKEEGKEIAVIHQTGEGDYPRVSEAYRKHGLQGEIMPFIPDMSGPYRSADIVVSRAGASTVSELVAMGIPSILIPYPHAADRHQETNARILAGVGGAEMVIEEDLNGQILADLLTRYMEDRPALKAMGDRARQAGRPHATRVIVESLADMMKA